MRMVSLDCLNSGRRFLKSWVPWSMTWKHCIATRHHPLKTKTASETDATLQAILAAFPPEARRTISYDNGPEFAPHRNLEAALGTEAFFRDPHSPWQRRTIENTNGIFRRDMPRKTDITNYSAQDIADLAWAINSTPRKCLGFKTPAEAFLKNLTFALEM